MNRLIETLKAWQAKAPSECESFIQSLDRDASTSKDIQSLNVKTLGDMINKFMTSTEDGKRVMRKSNGDIRKILYNHTKGKDLSVFNPLDFYQAQNNISDYQGERTLSAIYHDFFERQS